MTHSQGVMNMPNTPSFLENLKLVQSALTNLSEHILNWLTPSLPLGG